MVHPHSRSLRKSTRIPQKPITNGRIVSVNTNNARYPKIRCQHVLNYSNGRGEMWRPIRENQNAFVRIINNSRKAQNTNRRFAHFSTFHNDPSNTHLTYYNNHGVPIRKHGYANSQRGRVNHNIVGKFAKALINNETCKMQSYRNQSAAAMAAAPLKELLASAANRTKKKLNNKARTRNLTREEKMKRMNCMARSFKARRSKKNLQQKTKGILKELQNKKKLSKFRQTQLCRIVE